MEKWTPIAPMAIERSNFNTEVINNKIYALGGSGTGTGNCLSSVEEYDLATNTWTALASMQFARSQFQTEVINGKIYAVGGVGENNHYLSTTEVYDPTTNTWTALASMVTARYLFQTAVINGKIYAFGGRNSIFISSVEVYDPANNTWTTLAPMPTERVSFQSEVVDGEIYAIGGICNASGLSSVDVFDPATNTWSERSSMQTARAHFQSIVINGKIYVVGGKTNRGNDLSSAEVYDPTTNTWTTLASMPTPKRLFETEVIEGKIYAIGGMSISNGIQTFLSSAESYDPSTNVWTVLSSMLEARGDLQTEVINGKIYAIGGRIALNTSLASSEVFTAIPIVSPTSLTAIGHDSNVVLSWDAVTGATSYNVYRALTSGGPYTQIATGVAEITYTDSTVTNGTTYYYVVTAVSSAGESAYSNEASATPNADETGKALLDIYMVDNILREYDLAMSKVIDFIDWYKLRAAGTGDPFFIFEKTYNKGSFTSRNDYIIFDKIRDFEVNQ